MAALAFAMTGCGEHKKDCIIINKQSIGKIVDVQMIPTNWTNTQIRTENAVVILDGLQSIPLNVEAYQVTYEDGSRFFGYEGCVHLKRMY